jgi:hypothetical protein
MLTFKIKTRFTQVSSFLYSTLQLLPQAKTHASSYTEMHSTSTTTPSTEPGSMPASTVTNRGWAALSNELRGQILPMAVGNTGKWFISEDSKMDSAGGTAISGLLEMTDRNHRFLRALAVMTTSKSFAHDFMDWFFGSVNAFVVGNGKYTSTIDSMCGYDLILLLKHRMAILIGTLELPAKHYLSRTVFANFPGPTTADSMVWLYGRGARKVAEVFGRLKELQLNVPASQKHSRFQALVDYAQGKTRDWPVSHASEFCLPGREELDRTLAEMIQTRLGTRLVGRVNKTLCWVLQAYANLCHF